MRKYSKKGGKVSSLMNKEVDSEPVYGDKDKNKNKRQKDIKTRMKIYGDNVNTNFYGKKIPKEKTSCKCLSLVMLDSAIRVNKNHYPQTPLKECIYEIKQKNLMNDGLDPSSSDNETNCDSDNDTDNEPDNDESNK